MDEAYEREALMSKLGGEHGAAQFLRGESTVRLSHRDIAAWKVVKPEICRAVNKLFRARDETTRTE
ncbi:MAG: hypothetical protein JWN18_660 [Parcubacteria group bacterium]|nr:hypothetical protein [Parcubacteria group bacterium]